jgi:Holliday junction resolvasome RuvABC endonuclease subunit
MVVCGIDASTKSTGWSIFDGKELTAYGVIKPEGQDWRERIVNQAPKLIEILNKYHPDKIYMEDVPLKAQNPKVLVQLGAVQGFFMVLRPRLIYLLSF